ncbi:MAG: hypothetical protein ACI88H_001636 [Cocleimonas sp.]|jgi:hypothetical protein
MNKLPTIYNSNVELATRASIILSGLHNKKIDLNSLVFLDFALLYSQEFGGPENLHPIVPNYIAEIAQRRELLPDSLSYFINKGLLTKKFEPTGQYYSINNNTTLFLSCLQSDYYKKIWKRMSWLNENFEDITSKGFNVIINRGSK